MYSLHPTSRSLERDRYHIIQLQIIAGVKYNDYQIKFMPAMAYIYELAATVMINITKILLVGLLCSCTSDQGKRNNTEQTLQIREVDLLESFKMWEDDSLHLINVWKTVINDLGNVKDNSLDTVVCWSCEDYQQGYYPKSDSLLIDSCISRYLLPLKKSRFWQLLKSNNYDVEIHKRQSEKVGLYCISFPRDHEVPPTPHLFKHYFYFRKTANQFLFHGYMFN
jgi:hypothetical protein